jgi:spermidine/putrescine-binding protein
MTTVPRIGRRGLLTGAAALAGAAAMGLPASRARAAGTLKVGTYGGYFKDSFDEHIYPDFTAETGIEVESVAEPTGEAWLVQLETAARAGQAPADVSMMAQVTRFKGEKARSTRRSCPTPGTCSRTSSTATPTAGSTASVPCPGTSRW